MVYLRIRRKELKSRSYLSLTADEITFAFEAEDASIVKKGWPVGYFSTKHGQERELWMRDDGKNAE